jgi:hypothetical protein
MRGFGAAPVFDPVQGTIGGVAAGVLYDAEDEAEGPVVEVEIFGSGPRISGQIETGRFDRLSGWINMQSGFIAVYDVPDRHAGPADGTDLDRWKGPLWVRLDQIVMLGERSELQAPHPGTPIVEKRRRRVSIVTPGYRLEGNLHIHAHGSMSQLLESPEPHFLPLTDVTVRDLSNPRVVARFPFAIVNRDQVVTIAVASAPSSRDLAPEEALGA